MALLTCCQARPMLPDGPSQGAEKLLKQGARVVWAGRRLRVILDSEHRQIPVPEAFDGSVIEVHMRDLELTRPLHRPFIAFDREAMILGGNKHSPRLDFLHGMISAAMPVRH